MIRRLALSAACLLAFPFVVLGGLVTGAAVCVVGMARVLVDIWR